MKLNKITTAVAVSATTALLASGSLHAAVPHTFSAGSAAVAAEVNENFDNLDQRVIALESAAPSTTVAVDCNADSSALKNTTLTPNTTYVLTGMCDGQIAVDAGLGIIRIQGDATGSNDDGIILPAGETDGDTVFAAIYGTNGAHLILSNLTISGANYNGAGDLHIGTIGSYRAAHVVLEDVEVIGGDEGLGAYNTGTFSVRESVNIIEWRGVGIMSSRNSVVRIFNDTTITGGSNQEGDYSEGITAIDGGVVSSADGTDITAATGPAINADNSAAISSFRNGTITLRDGTLTGNVWSGESSSVDLRNITHSGGNLDAYRNGVIRVRNSDVVGASGDRIWAGGFSSIRLDDTIVNNVSGTGTLDTYRYGGIDIRGNSDLNGRDINCADSRELNIGGSVLNVGTTC